MVFCKLVNMYNNKYATKNENFYDVEEIQPKSLEIDNIKFDIIEEVSNLQKNEWSNWIEENLYQKEKWKFFPLNVFGKWIKINCEQCPTTYKFLKNIDSVEMVLFSRLEPGTKIDPHTGWGKYSNNVIRCHYGIDIPNECYLIVNNEVKHHKQFNWTCFDDSKIHSAMNDSNKDRIVLIVDIKRPNNIAKGTSTTEDTTELKDALKYYDKLEKI